MIHHLEVACIPAELQSLRCGIKAFIAEHLPAAAPEQRARSWMGFNAEFSQMLAKHGWLGLTLPRVYGGQGMGFFARFIVAEELLAVGAPVAAHWIADRQSGPLIARYGTEEQKQFYLPKICAAQAFFCIGMSEANSGSDLASIRSHAVDAGEHWCLSGSKIWTTYAQHAHYMLALVRTDGSPTDRQQGLSQLIIDLRLPGITIRPITDLAGDEHFCEVFFDEVKIPKNALIGERGKGWEQVNAELAYERSGPERLLSSIVLAQEYLSYLHTQPSLTDNDYALLGKMVQWLSTLRAMSLSLTAALEAGQNPALAAALVKDLGTSIEQSIPAWIADSLGENPDAQLPAALLRTLAYTEQMAPTFSLRGGTREILRGIIARGMGLR